GYTIALPALPVNGRTTYMGNLFVNNVRLDRSPMKDHPLNPMTEADLKVWLGYQTKREIGLCDHNTVKMGASTVAKELKRLGESGAEIIIVDAIDQKDIRTIAEAVSDYRLVSGSSALAMELPPIWKRNKLLSRKKTSFGHADMKRSQRSGGILVVAGSCSEVTISQNKYALNRGFLGLKLNTAKIVESQRIGRYTDEVERVVKEATKYLRKRKKVIVYTAIDKKDLIKTNPLGRILGFNNPGVGEVIANANAEIVKAVADEVGLN